MTSGRGQKEGRELPAGKFQDMSKYQRINSSGFVTVDVSPTFISSDLLTPAAKSRVTLPTIA